MSSWEFCSEVSVFLGILKENSLWMLVPNYYWNSKCIPFTMLAFVLSQGEFKLETNFNPNILVEMRLDYDKVKEVTMTLYAQVSLLHPGLTFKDASFCTNNFHLMTFSGHTDWIYSCGLPHCLNHHCSQYHGHWQSSTMVPALYRNCDWQKHNLLDVWL